MYLVEFFKRMARKSNIPVLIYLVLNVFIITEAVSLLFGEPIGYSFVYGMILYIISLTIALSPIGEWILRMQTGCRVIKRPDQLEYIMPIFNEVYEKAKQQDPSISNNVKLYINDDPVPNAFATGRRTVCMTQGMINMPTDQIKATLGHEFGHLAHKDTDLILVVTVGNMIVSGIILFIRVCIDIFHIVFGLMSLLIGGSEGVVAMIVNALYHMMLTAIVAGLTWLWTKLGTLLVMKSSRSNEYEADGFSCDLGYGNELCALLNSIGGSGAKGLFANLASSHPDSNDRIVRIQQRINGNYNF